jgi:hypothetical protein
MKSKFLATLSLLLMTAVVSGCHKNTSACPSATPSTSSSEQVTSASTSKDSPVSGSPSVSASVSASVSTSVAPAHVLTSKSVTCYVNSMASSAPMNVYFDNNNEEIPFFSLAEFFPIAAGLLGYTQQTATLALTGNVLTVTMPNGETALLDFDAGTMTIPHREGFLASLGRTSALDILSASGFVSADNKVCYVEDLDSSSYNQGNTVVIDLKAYQIPMILDNGVGYLPLQTFSDFILNPIGLAFYYNGQTLYLATGSLGDMKDSYYSAKTGNRSATLADFTYRELCLNLDSNYGLKAEHKITTFDDYFTRTGRKADLLSTDPQKADAALAYVLANDLDDGHSKSVGPSYLSGADFDVRNSKYNGVSNLAWDSTSSTFTAAREKALGKTISPYEVVGDTAFITFDEFTSRTSDYYATAPTLENAAKDTFALVGYAQKQITTNSAIKNVVVDLSCNGGGSADAALYIGSWMTGKATVNLENPETMAQATTSYRCDTNYDHVCDDTDTLAGKGLHIYGLTTLCSFSCGNLLPNLLKQSHAVSLIGQRTGGGACVAENSSNADGGIYRISGDKMLCNSINGSFYNIDSGVEPDYYLQNPASYYDRSALSTYLDSLR